MSSEAVGCCAAHRHHRHGFSSPSREVQRGHRFAVCEGVGYGTQCRFGARQHMMPCSVHYFGLSCSTPVRMLPVVL